MKGPQKLYQGLYYTGNCTDLLIASGCNNRSFTYVFLQSKYPVALGSISFDSPSGPIDTYWQLMIEDNNG